MKCSNCQHKSKQFFSIKLPIYPFSISKEIKKSMPQKLNNSITLKYNSCSNCGYIYSNISTEDFELLELIYKEYYNYMNKTNVVNYAMDSLLDILSPYLKNRDSLAEIGCYDGSFLLELQKRNPSLKLLGIEPSQIGSKSAKEKGFEVINDFFPSEKLTQKVDIIISSHVIEHVPDIYTFLESQTKQLTANGIIVFETPNLDWAIINGSNKPFHFQHLVLLSKKYIKSLLFKLGLNYVNIFEIDWRIVVVCSKEKTQRLFSLEEFDFKDDKMLEYLESFQERISAEEIAFKKLLRDSQEKFWLWGASSFCGNILANLNKNELSKIDGILDSDKEKDGNEFLFSQLDVTLPRRINELNIKSIIIMSTYEKEIMDYIKTLSIEHDMKIYTLYSQLDSYSFNAKTNNFKKSINE